MNSRNFSNFIGFTVGLVILMLLSFGVLQWLQVPTGSFLDWVIGAASFWWLMAIVTVPWNIHFRAKAVLAGAAESQERGIAVDDRQVQYTSLVARRSFWAAIALHVFSAAGLYALAAAGISAIGYISSGATLLFTALRPAVAFYQYLTDRLSNIGRQFRYPREDIVEVRHRLTSLEDVCARLELQLDIHRDESFAASQIRSIESVRGDLSRLATAHEDLRATNQAEHDRLAREARNAIAQLTTDGQFLDNVREIIRFFKTA
ncbi:hypothetical protein IQ235_10730 [Oscillatoriales cyanobacterium LEGE 11467]|uniref:Uncharacterized protein n=1 Tax=Zarconia navalis LEGE 11467 TaxID=1828826 RepID=A0A928VVT3_9CYAN|nr:hypothetical protein [Zarconia navalis]MBE9041254.1 hypothetical protein [Zarconia navalis LEGE 11467]